MNTQKTNWVTLKEAINYTCLGNTTLRNAIYSGTLKASRQTGKILFRQEWLDKYLMFGRQWLNHMEQVEFNREFKNG